MNLSFKFLKSYNISKFKKIFIVILKNSLPGAQILIYIILLPLPRIPLLTPIMFGDHANKLILEARRANHLAELPLHLHGLVKDIVEEIGHLNKDVEYLNEQQSLEDIVPDEARIHQCQLFVTHLCLRRNKRCLLAYQKMRADKISEFLWLNVDPLPSTEASGLLSKTDFSAPINHTLMRKLVLLNLSHAEQEYYKLYQDLVLDFKSGFADIDLSGDLEPPTEIFIDVRVLRSGGEIQTEYGVFNLIKDSQFYVRKLDVDRLIQQGYLEEI